MVSTTKHGTVWILGAGFSRPLGAPLFKTLFRSHLRVTAAFGAQGEELRDGTLAILRQYLAHAPPEMGGQGDVNGVLWGDPEEFLELAESAAEGNANAAMIKAGRAGEPSELSDKGRRALAIECSHFLRGADPSTERWLPYAQWSKAVGSSDTIVTFNYDRVPNFLERGDGAKLRVIEPLRDRSGIDDVRERGGAPVLKLHGSVDWVVRNNAIVVDERDDLPIRCESGRDLVLAVPGPGKATIHRTYKFISILWQEALMAIAEATRIVFLGYRFPPTDARARMLFLSQIAKAATGRDFRSVDVVLGPDVNAPDVVRMKALLSQCGLVRVFPLYVEDFLSMPGLIA